MGKSYLGLQSLDKNAMGVTCYLRGVENGKKFVLTCFRRQDKTYRLGDDGVDFTLCPVGARYRLRVELNGKGRASLKEMEPIH